MQEETNIYLIGLMGAGKTTIGRQLARRLGREFYDSDHELESRTGVRIPIVFEIEGEDGFRAREAQMIAELTEKRPVVLATGGGAVLNAQTRQRLHGTGWVVYLAVPPPLLYERTRLDRNRPLLQIADPLKKLEDLYEQRDPLYRETAHLIVDGSHSLSSGIVLHIIHEYQHRCAL
ncbi:MAG: shikimate kinase [Proteobacteria bacterium]|nr:shikimate kinase [Pseudomonadota bacterium]